MWSLNACTFDFHILKELKKCHLLDHLKVPVNALVEVGSEAEMESFTTMSLGFISSAFSCNLSPQHHQLSLNTSLNPRTVYPSAIAHNQTSPLSQKALTKLHPLSSKYPKPLPDPFANLSPHHFVNLTNGLEALQTLSTLLPTSDIRFTRIQSSHCESGAYDKLLLSLDNELLLSLACGRICYVYDFASRNKTYGVPRAIFLGIEFVKWSLAYLWFASDAPEKVPERVLVRGKNTVPFWRDELMQFKISRDSKKKIRYFTPFAKEMGISEVKLVGVYGRVSEIDGCKSVHVKMMREWLEMQSENEPVDGNDTTFAEWTKRNNLSEFNANSSGEELLEIQERMKQL